MEGNKIAEARKQRGLSQQELANLIDTSQKQIYLYESGKRDPKTEVIVKIAHALDVTVPYLLGIAAIPYEPQRTYRLPVLGRIAAGTPREAFQVSDEWHEVRESVYAKHAKAFWLVVAGNSMNRLFPEGALVLIDPEERVLNGDVAAVFVNGDDATLKRVYFEGDSVRLHPESHDPEYRDRVIDRSDPDAPMVRIIGKAVTYTAPDGWRG